MDAYIRREKGKVQDKLRALSALPARWRQQNRAEYRKVVAERPAYIAMEVDHRLAGNFGAGEYHIAMDIMASPRMNRAAAFAQLIAGLEWECSGMDARKAYLSLSDGQKATIDTAIGEVIAEHEGGA